MRRQIVLVTVLAVSAALGSACEKAPEAPKSPTPVATQSPVTVQTPTPTTPPVNGADPKKSPDGVNGKTTVPTDVKKTDGVKPDTNKEVKPPANTSPNAK